MQPSTPPRQSTCRVHGHGVFAVPDRHSHYSEQFDGQLSFSASDAGPYRSFGTSMRRGRRLALDHGLVYLHPAGGQNHPLRLELGRHPVRGAVLGMVVLLVRRVPADVDAPAGETGGQTRVLALFTDGQR
jgi:hypothetical protein